MPRCSRRSSTCSPERRPRRRRDAAPLLDPLSDAELRVLRYLPSNLKTPEIAAELFVSANTVRTHVRHIYAKLDAHDRTEAVARARALRLLGPGPTALKDRTSPLTSCRPRRPPPRQRPTPGLTTVILFVIPPTPATPETTSNAASLSRWRLTSPLRVSQPLATLTSTPSGTPSSDSRAYSAAPRISSSRE